MDEGSPSTAQKKWVIKLSLPKEMETLRKDRQEKGALAMNARDFLCSSR
jgi:hypothetical protein